MACGHPGLGHSGALACSAIGSVTLPGRTRHASDMDRVWVAIEGAVQDGLRDRHVLGDPPQSMNDWEWVSATITDHVCASLPRDLYQAYKALLSESAPPPETAFDITPH